MPDDFRSALARQAEAEVMACIGCHDCMLACPLPQASTIGIAELNAAVHQAHITSPRVVDFLSACTQCRQCVPVCPADLSRADMVLYNKIKVEDALPDHALMLQIGDEAVASSWTLDAMAQQLAAIKLFGGVAAQDLRRVLLKSTLRQLEANEELCREGEFHERLYVVLSGALEQTSDVAGHKLRILTFSPGSFFGELAIMADAPEPFGVRALGTSIVLEIPKAAVHLLMQQSPTFGATMDELYRRRALWTYARKPTVFGNLPEPAMEELVAAAELMMVKAGQVVFREGDTPRDVYLVRSGFLRASKRIDENAPQALTMMRRMPIAAEPSLSGSKPPTVQEAVLTYFREGDLVGALPLALGETRHSFTITASSRAEVIKIPGHVLLRVLARYPQSHEAMVKGAMEVEQFARNSAPHVGERAKVDTPQIPATPEPPRRVPRPTHVLPMSWSALVDAGIAQGHEVLVVDQNKCVNCKNCIDACERRHGHSRLQLRGLQVENYLFPTACRHCDDPVCLLCSVNGIVRRPTGEIAIVEENCIGCGACAQRCPYGNITMHPVEQPKKGWVRSLIDLLRGGEAKAAYEREIDPKVPQKAHKCDLCAEHEDYACVTACPVGAMFRVDPKSAMTSLGAPARRGTPVGT